MDIKKLTDAQLDHSIKEKVNEIADLNHAKENTPETSTLGWLGITIAIAHREKQVRSARAEKTKRIATHE